MKTIVIGIGNSILGDDGIGIHIVNHIRNHYALPDTVFFEEAQTGGMNLLDLMKGYDRAILIDAVSLPTLDHGMIKQFHLDDLPTIHSHNPHDVSLPEAIHLAKTLGDTSVPTDIIIIGINLKEIPMEFSDVLSPQIQKCIPIAADMVLKKLRIQSNDLKDFCDNRMSS